MSRRGGGGVCSVANLKSWLKARGEWIASGVDASTTHVFMDGGAANVRDIEEFCRYYARCVCEPLSAPVCCVEFRQSAAVFNMFVDVDCTEGFPGDGSAASKLEVAIRHLVENIPGSVVVCRPLQPYRGRHGAHLVWPNKPVTCSQALDLLAAVGATPLVDVSVYRGARGAGLRMLGSQKPRYPKDYVYWPVAVRWPESACLTPVQPPEKPLELVRWLRLCCIHATDSCLPPALCTLNPNHPPPPQSSSVAPAAVLCCSKVVSVLDELLPEVYRGTVRAHAVHQMGGTIVVPLASRYCHNKLADHSSNHVYICVTARGGFLEQRCHCTSPVVRPGTGTSCANFKMRLSPKPLHPAILSFLRGSIPCSTG
jgi:hypothetical protein